MEPTSSPAAPQEPSVEPPAAPEPSPSAPDPGISQTVPRNDGPPPPPPFASPTPDSPSGPESIAPATPATPAMPAPLPTVMVGDGGTAPPAPAGGTAAPVGPVAPSVPGRGRKVSKKLLIAIIAVVVILVGAAAFYFGYFMNSSVIYSQSLKNTGKGYDKLVDFVDKQEKLTQKGYTGNGSYKVKFGEFSTDGKINLKGDSDNTELTFDVGLGITRVNADVRTLKSSGDTPDVYVKVADIKGLGTVLGIPDLDASLAKIDNSWIVIDHTLIDNLSSIATTPVTGPADASSLKSPTRDQVLDEARAFGKVNQDYLFSTSKDKSVTKVVKKYGIETVDGHKTYHYKIALQKDNVKKYIYAQRDALKKSTLNDWLKKNKYDKDVYAAFDDAAKSTKDIKSSETYDIWMDVNQRVTYKVRVNDTSAKTPADNYVDVGLGYKGGDTFPLFISGKSKFEDETDTFSFTATIDTKSNNTNFKLDVDAEGGSNPGTVTANFDFKPSTGAIKISKPAGAKPLSQVLTELGFGDVLAQYNNSAQDSKSNPN